MSSGKRYFFSFQEGYWYREFTVTADETGRFVESFNPESVLIVNCSLETAQKRGWNERDIEKFDMENPESSEEFDGNVDKLIWAFENRLRRKDARDVCKEVTE